MKKNGQKTILLVEDDAITALIEKNSLEKNGYNVITTNAGEKAVEILSTTTPIDLVLMDIDLGDGIDGIEAAELILRSRDLPVVFLSSHTSREITEKTEKISSYGYVLKNSSFAVLDTSLKMAFKLFDAKTALQENEKKYRTLFEQSLDAIMTLEAPSWKFTNGNPSAIEMFKAKNEAEFVSYAPWHFSPERQPDGRASDEKAKEMIEKAVRDGSNFFEWTHKRITGEEFTATVLLSKMTLAGKVFLQSTVRDITEHKRIEDALRKSENMFREIFEIMPIGLWVADKTGKLLHGNPAGIAIWGAEPRVAQEKYGVFKARRLPSREEIRPDDWALAHTVKEGVTVIDELLEIDAFDGKKKIILNYTAPIMDSKGKVEGAIVVNQDITERRRMEQDIVRISTLEREGIALDLHDSVAQQITGVGFLCNILKGRMKDVADKKALEDIEIGLHRALDQIKQIAHGLFPVGVDKEGLRHLLQHLAENVSTTYKINCQVEQSDDCPADFSVGGSGHLYYIVQEAIMNAVRHAHPHNIILSCSSKEITVRDDGVGFDALLVGEKRMGLRTMRYRANIIGASLEIDSCKGEGTSVRVGLGTGGPVGR